MYDDAEPIDQPDAEEPKRDSLRSKPIPDGALQAIVDHYRAAYLARDFDYDLRRPAQKLARGSAEHAKAFRQAPQWHQHVGMGPTGRKANYLTLIRNEAYQRYGPDAAEAVRSLL